MVCQFRDLPVAKLAFANRRGRKKNSPASKFRGVCCEDQAGPTLARVRPPDQYAVPSLCA
jgi:hypothetical protein